MAFGLWKVRDIDCFRGMFAEDPDLLDSYQHSECDHKFDHLVTVCDVTRVEFLIVGSGDRYYQVTTIVAIDQWGDYWISDEQMYILEAWDYEPYRAPFQDFIWGDMRR